MPGLSGDPQVVTVVAFQLDDASSIESLAQAITSTSAFATADDSSQVAADESANGIALVFLSAPSLAAECATQVQAAFPAAKIGLHTGLVRKQLDVSGEERLAGEGLATARSLAEGSNPGEIRYSNAAADWLKSAGSQASGSGTATPALGKKVVLLYRRKTEPDESVLGFLESELRRNGYDVFIDRHLRIGVEWAKEIETQIRSADTVIPIVSPRALQSEMIEYELETAQDQFQKSGKPIILPVRLGEEPPEGPIAAIINPLNGFEWSGPEDNQRLLVALLSAMAEPLEAKDREVKLEPVGGAVPPDSPFYIERVTDAEFRQALQDRESIILVKGPRQIGKTSLMAQGIKLAREQGWRVAVTDFQKLGSAQLASDDVFLKLLAATLCKQLGFKYDFEEEWLDVFGAGLNMETFLRALIESSNEPVVWFMDEVDKVFGAPLASDFFGLVRSWHNSRSTEPGGPWDMLTVVIGYATEAHLFIQDLNQSPFNVGHRIDLDDFNTQQIVDLNHRHGGLLRSHGEVERLQSLVGGQPFLARRAFEVLARGKMDLDALIERAADDDGPFGDHLKRILVSLTRFAPVHDAMKQVLSTKSVDDTDSFYRLQAAGLVKKAEGGMVVPRCELYQRYLSKHL